MQLTDRQIVLTDSFGGIRMSGLVGTFTTGWSASTTPAATRATTATKRNVQRRVLTLG